MMTVWHALKLHCTQNASTSGFPNNLQLHRKLKTSVCEFPYPKSEIGTRLSI